MVTTYQFVSLTPALMAELLCVTDSKRLRPTQISDLLVGAETLLRFEAMVDNIVHPVSRINVQFVSFGRGI